MAILISALVEQYMSPSLEQLEDNDWGPPNWQSHLVTICYQLRKKDIDALSTEELRVMIGQNIGIPHLLPIALNMLEANPLAEGSCYPDDLLHSVVLIKTDFYQSETLLARRVASICRQAIPGLTSEDSTLCKLFSDFADKWES